MPRIRPAIGGLAVLLLVSACASASPATSSPEATPSAIPSPVATAPATSLPASSDAAVSIKGFAFNPATLTVAAGTEVVWTNDEDSLHTVTSGTPESPDGLFDSGEIDTGDQLRFTYTTAGTYPFFCARHDFMTGEIVVTP